MNKKLDALNNVGKKARLQTNEDEGKPEKQYKTEKVVRGLNTELEKFYDEQVSKDLYPNYTTFIRSAIYELAKKHGYK